MESIISKFIRALLKVLRVAGKNLPGKSMRDADKSEVR